MIDERGQALGKLVAAAEATGRAAFVRLGAALVGVAAYNQALATLEALQEHPLDRLARATGESKEALIAELQAGMMDYREFYCFKMARGKSDD